MIGVVGVAIVVAGLSLWIAGTFSAPSSGNVAVCKTFKRMGQDVLAGRQFDAKGVLAQIQAARPRDSGIAYLVTHTSLFGSQLVIPPAIPGDPRSFNLICATYGVDGAAIP